MRYRKKPVDADAVRVSEVIRSILNGTDLPNWVSKMFVENHLFIGFSRLEIKLPGKGLHSGSERDWIVRDETGVRVVSTEEFHERFEARS